MLTMLTQACSKEKENKMEDRVSHKINFTNIREQFIHILTPAKFIFRWLHFINIITYASTYLAKDVSMAILMSLDSPMLCAYRM